MPKNPKDKTAMVEPPLGTSPAHRNIGANDASLRAAAEAKANLPRNIPRVDESTDNLPKVPGDQPPNTAYSGSYTKQSDGEEYALAVVEDDPNGRTHKAKNSLHFWEGTKAEFRAQFDVKDNDKRAPKDDDK
jgi:hypothetical protein